MLRLSDARMSGTAYGTIVLHVAPEAATGGPLALVRNGDKIKLSVKNQTLDLLEALWKSRDPIRLFRETVLQAPQGCDFNFLRKV